MVYSKLKTTVMVLATVALLAKGTHMPERIQSFVPRKGLEEKHLDPEEELFGLCGGISPGETRPTIEQLAKKRRQVNDILGRLDFYKMSGSVPGVTLPVQRPTMDRYFFGGFLLQEQANHSRAALEYK